MPLSRYRTFLGVKCVFLGLQRFMRKRFTPQRNTKAKFDLTTTVTSAYDSTQFENWTDDHIDVQATPKVAHVHSLSTHPSTNTYPHSFYKIDLSRYLVLTGRPLNTKCDFAHAYQQCRDSCHFARLAQQWPPTSMSVDGMIALSIYTQLVVLLENVCTHASHLSPFRRVSEPCWPIKTRSHTPDAEAGGQRGRGYLALHPTHHLLQRWTCYGILNGISQNCLVISNSSKEKVQSQISFWCSWRKAHLKTVKPSQIRLTNIHETKQRKMNGTHSHAEIYMMSCYAIEWASRHRVDPRNIPNGG